MRNRNRRRHHNHKFVLPALAGGDGRPLIAFESGTGCSSVITRKMRLPLQIITKSDKNPDASLTPEVSCHSPTYFYFRPKA